MIWWVDPNVYTKCNTYNLYLFPFHFVLYCKPQRCTMRGHKELWLTVTTSISLPAGCTLFCGCRGGTFLELCTVCKRWLHMIHTASLEKSYMYFFSFFLKSWDLTLAKWLSWLEHHPDVPRLWVWSPVRALTYKNQPRSAYINRTNWCLSLFLTPLSLKSIKKKKELRLMYELLF